MKSNYLQYFVINYKLKVFICFNLNLSLKLNFCHQYQLIIIYHFKFIVKILWI